MASKTTCVNLFTGGQKREMERNLNKNVPSPFPTDFPYQDKQTPETPAGSARRFYSRQAQHQEVLQWLSCQISPSHCLVHESLVNASRPQHNSFHALKIDSRMLMDAHKESMVLNFFSSSKFFIIFKRYKFR